MQTMKELAQVRLVIADDHELVRAGIRSMFAREPDLEVVGEAKNGLEALALCRQVRPDLVLMDLRMPEMDGLAATRAIRREGLGTKVLMLTVYENPDYLLEALKAGVAGYVLKDATRHEVLAAVRQALRGDTPLNSKLVVELLQRMIEGHENLQTGPEDCPKLGAELLTPREVEVLRFMAQGQTNHEIAQNMMFSVHTVKVHVKRIFEKLEVSDRTQAAVRANELGMLIPEPRR